MPASTERGMRSETGKEGREYRCVNEQVTTAVSPGAQSYQGPLGNYRTHASGSAHKRPEGDAVFIYHLPRCSRRNFLPKMTLEQSPGRWVDASKVKRECPTTELRQGCGRHGQEATCSRKGGQRESQRAQPLLCGQAIPVGSQTHKRKPSQTKVAAIKVWETIPSGKSLDEHDFLTLTTVQWYACAPGRWATWAADWLIPHLNLLWVQRAVPLVGQIVFMGHKNESTWYTGNHEEAIAGQKCYQLQAQNLRNCWIWRVCKEF